MRNGSQSRFKRHKMRMLPGDLPLPDKIAMMEGKGVLEPKHEKAFRKFQEERAASSFRQAEEQEIQSELNDNDEQ